MFAGTPGALHPMRDELPANRLGLARWLVDPDNPLVARVTVNRLWEQIFGRGLVETSEDFGAAGSAPVASRAARLARDRVRRPRLEPEGTAADDRLVRDLPAVLGDVGALSNAIPNNRLFARGPRFRMEAEMIRDVALAASGLLSRKMHGPSVFPLQPDGIWDIPYNQDKWVTSEGEDRYRRSLYTFLRRTSPYPSFMTFDATSREYCTVRRVRTNTPLQALTLLNDRAAFEAARALARPHASTTRRRGRRRVASRQPMASGCASPARAESDEVARLVALFEEERQHFESNPEAGREVVSYGPPG